MPLPIFIEMLLLTIWLISVIVVVGCMCAAESKRAVPFNWAKGPDYWELFFVLFLVLCPIINSVLALVSFFTWRGWRGS